MEEEVWMNATLGGTAMASQDGPPGGNTAEVEMWVNAACQVLSLLEKDMHYSEIKRVIMQNKLVTDGLQTTLESALYREIQKPNAKLKKLAGPPGMFALMTDGERAAPVQASPQVTHRAPPIQTHRVTHAHPESSTYKVNSVQGRHEVMNGTVDKYRVKYQKLRKFVKHMVFVNAAVCDEVVRMEEKVTKVKAERRYLLKKLLGSQSVADVWSQMRPQPNLLSQPTTPPPGGGTSLPSTSPMATSADNSTVATNVMATAGSDKAAKMKKKQKKKVLKDQPQGTLSDAPDLKAKVKKSSKSGGRRLAQPIPLDSAGRPVLPIEFGPLTIYSVGEIVSDRPGFHNAQHIFPVGFVSTREYASIRQSQQTCLYTCKISDTGNAPKFEISPDDNPGHVLSGRTASECHSKLLQAINAARGYDIVTTEGKGPEFFGISHPTVQNLIQSCPGSRKCTKYKWVRFEICRTEAEIPKFCEDEPSVNFEALLLVLQAKQQMALQEGRPSHQQVATHSQQQQMAALEPSASLRSLLTSAPLKLSQ